MGLRKDCSFQDMHNREFFVFIAAWIEEDKEPIDRTLYFKKLETTMNNINDVISKRCSIYVLFSKDMFDFSQDS